MKKTKIVATIGPVTESVEMLSKAFEAGVNVARLNFSHGTQEEHANKIKNIREAVKKTGINAAILQDLSGPKFRIGDFKAGIVNLKAGDTIVLTTKQVEGDEKMVSVNYPTLAQELKPGSIVMVDDGKKKFEVLKIDGGDITCKIIVGGDTKSRRSVNLPGAYLKISSLTDKDKDDLAFGLKHDVDFVAFSFVRSPEDVKELRALIDAAKSDAMIISKIETQEAVQNFDAILELSDGIMVARGDLAVEIGPENVPAVQKMMIRKCNEAGKPVITATQMLESMINSPVPTRAEVSDVANAIFDGTDAVMLSEETTLGKFPIEAISLMARVATNIEGDPLYRSVMENRKKKIVKPTENIADALTSEAVDVATRLGATVIVALTHTGFTAQKIARFKAEQPLLALTPSETTARQLLLSYGCMPVHNKGFEALDEAISEIRKIVVAEKLAVKGDKVVVSGGIPFEHQKDTNMVLVETV